MMRATTPMLAALAALAAPVALAQSVAITGTPTTPVLCDSGHIMQTVSGGTTVFTDLPVGSNNVIILTALNGGAPVTTFATEPAGSSSVGTGQIYLYTPSSTSPPYTMDRWTFPASGGVAIGTGVHETGTCSASFEAAVTWTNGVLPAGGGGGGGGPVPAASLAPVPTLSASALAWLVLAVAALAAFALRRSAPMRRA
jgi:hypothetical protein